MGGKQKKINKSHMYMKI